MADRIFGIKINKNAEKLTADSMYSTLALHLFCNLNIDPKRADYILHESRWLTNSGLENLIKKIRTDYQTQPRGYELIEDTNSMSLLNDKMNSWFDIHFLPNQSEIELAEEILDLLPGSIDEIVFPVWRDEDFEPIADDMLEIYQFLESEKEREQSLMDAVHSFANKFVDALKDQEEVNNRIDDTVPKKSPVPTDTANIVMGVDFNLYLHVSPTFRKQFAQNLFLDENLFPDIHIENILKHNGLCSAAEKFIVGFDCRLKEEVEISYETIMKGILGLRYMLGFISEEEYDELMFKHGFDEDNEEEITLGEKYALELDLKPFEKGSENILDRLFQVADRINLWSDTFCIPTEDEINETLAQAEIDYRDVVCLRYLVDRFKSLENYSINPSDLIKFLNKYKEFLEIEQTNSILDAYLKLKES